MRTSRTSALESEEVNTKSYNRSNKLTIRWYLNQHHKEDPLDTEFGLNLLDMLALDSSKKISVATFRMKNLVWRNGNKCNEQ